MQQILLHELYLSLLGEQQVSYSSLPAPVGLNLDSRYQNNPFYMSDTGGFLYEYLHSEDYFNAIKNHPLIIPNLPDVNYSDSDIWAMIKQNLFWVMTVPSTRLTQAMYQYVIFRDPRLLCVLSPTLQSSEVVLWAVRQNGMLLEYVREDLKLYYICNAALRQNWQAIEFIPDSIIDGKMVDTASSNPEAFLLGLIPENLVSDEVYSQSVKNNGIKSCQYLLKTTLNTTQWPNLLEILRTSNYYKPSVMFNVVDFSVLMDSDRKEALYRIIEQEPTFALFLKPCFVDDRIFFICLRAQVMLPLDLLNWTAERVGLAFGHFPKALINMPAEKVDFLFPEQLQQLVVIANEQGWLAELPNFFLKESIVTDPELHSLLMQARPAFNYIKSIGDDLDFFELEKLKPAASELVMIDKKIAAEQITGLLELDIGFFVCLEDLDKTLERSTLFLAKYPSLIGYLPKHIKEDNLMMRQLLTENANIVQYINQDSLTGIFTE